MNLLSRQVGGGSAKSSFTIPTPSGTNNLQPSHTVVNATNSNISANIVGKQRNSRVDSRQRGTNNSKGGNGNNLN